MDKECKMAKEECSVKLPLTLNEAVRTVLQNHGRDIMIKDKKRFIALLKDYSCSSEEVARMDYALTDQILAMWYEADKKEVTGLESKVNDVKKINNRLVSYNGFDRDIALGITKTLMYAFGWDMSIAETWDDLPEDLRDKVADSDTAAKSRSGDNRKSMASEDKLSSGEDARKHRKPEGSGQDAKLERPDRERILERRDIHTKVLFYVYLSAFCFCFIACVASAVIYAFLDINGSWVKIFPMGISSTMCVLGIKFFKKPFVQMLKDEAEAERLCLKYNAMEYFILISQGGKGDVVKAVLESVPKM